MAKMKKKQQNEKLYCPYYAPAFGIQILDNEINVTAKHVVCNPHLAV